METIDRYRRSLKRKNYCFADGEDLHEHRDAVHPMAYRPACSRDPQRDRRLRGSPLSETASHSEDDHVPPADGQALLRLSHQRRRR